MVQVRRELVAKPGKPVPLLLADVKLFSAREGKALCTVRSSHLLSNAKTWQE